MLDEPIHLEQYCLEWDEVFRSERNRLAACLEIPLIATEHIGSTAVPGISGKPIVDIMIGAQSVPPPAAWTEILVRLGYEAFGEAGVPGRWYFRLRTVPFRNAHIVERNGEHWVRNLALRNFLRRSPEAARRYEAAKLAAVSGATTLVAYSRAKKSVIEELLIEALKAERQCAA